MQHIQRVALDLFEREGYDEVTIARIAERAGVGERSIFRYFGTKAMLVFQDELDQRTVDLFAARLAGGTVLDAIRASLDELGPMMAGAEMVDSTRRLQLIHDHPQLRAALADYMNQLGDTLGAIIAAERGEPVSAQSARVQGRCIIAALSTAIEEWEGAGGSEPLAASLHAAIDALAELG